MFESRIEHLCPNPNSTNSLYLFLSNIKRKTLLCCYVVEFNTPLEIIKKKRAPIIVHMPVISNIHQILLATYILDVTKECKSLSINFSIEL